MLPRQESSPEHGREGRVKTLPHSHSAGVSGSQISPEIIVDANPNSNPWEGVFSDDWSNASLHNEHRTTLPLPESGFSTDQTRPPTRETTAQPRQGWSPQSRPERVLPIVGTRGPRLRPPQRPSSETNSQHLYSPDASSDSDGHSSCSENLGQKELVLEIQRLQKRLEILQHSDTNPDEAGDPSSPVNPWRMLHEVQCLDTEHLTYYLDEPELEIDQDLMHLHWQGVKHVTNVQAWIRKQKPPFVVRRQYYCVHERKEVSTPSENIYIRSCEVNDALMSWLEASSGLTIYGNAGVYANNVLKAPYLCFYHFRYEARQFLSASGSSSQGTLSLLEYLGASTAVIAEEAGVMFSSGKVTAKLMPYLFKPGALVCFEESGNSVVCEQTSVLTMVFESQDLQLRSYALTTVRVAFDGKFRHLRPYTHRINVKAVGDQPVNITDLSVRPLSCLPSEHRLELKRRGEVFMTCQRQLYVTYPSNGGHPDFVDTRFMVDVGAYHMLHDKEASEEVDSGSPISESSIDGLKDTEEFILQLPPTIEGFNMTEKKWIHLRVRDIKEVEWSPETFHSVEIEPESKELIEALVRNKIEREEGIDFVRGKGTGLVVLLHGGPGTGKTLTAEGVAEIAKKPLYRVTGGDVGTDPRAVERYLESVFYLGRRWNCVVLLDEADVFLEQRSFANLERNALVSVFLRVIEYYDGILILTSNRVGTFDEAFKSRIQLALHFDNLDADRRAKIWTKFIDRLKELNEDVDFDDVRAHHEDLARPEMNGRQIRNAVTTARQLARFRKTRLKYSHLKQAIGVSQKFEDYVKKVKGATDDEIAEEEMLRAPSK